MGFDHLFPMLDIRTFLFSLWKELDIHQALLALTEQGNVKYCENRWFFKPIVKQSQGLELLLGVCGGWHSNGSILKPKRKKKGSFWYTLGKRGMPWYNMFNRAASSGLSYWLLLEQSPSIHIVKCKSYYLFWMEQRVVDVPTDHLSCRFVTSSML